MPTPTTLPAPASTPPSLATVAARLELAAIDAALRTANAEGYLRYTLATVADRDARIAALEAELAAVRGAR